MLVLFIHSIIFLKIMTFYPSLTTKINSTSGPEYSIKTKVNTYHFTIKKKRSGPKLNTSKISKKRVHEQNRII